MAKLKLTVEHTPTAGGFVNVTPPAKLSRFHQVPMFSIMAPTPTKKQSAFEVSLIDRNIKGCEEAIQNMKRAVRRYRKERKFLLEYGKPKGTEKNIFGRSMQSVPEESNG